MISEYTQDSKKDRVKIEIKEKSELHEKLGDAHMNLLSTKKIVIVLLSLSLGTFISFADQTSVTVALTTIGKDLNAETTINWAGTSSLLANTVFQVLFGRLSDIFGRKTILISCLVILALADLICGFVTTGVQFFIFRAFAGIGNGGVSSLSMVILSDIVTLEQRGKYQGILGASIGIGNAVGPLIMAGFIHSSSWRNFYHLMAPLITIIAVSLYFLIPSKPRDSILTGKQKIMKLDFLGFATSTISLTLILIAISGGGTIYKWNSAIVISFLTIGGIMFFVFLLVEWKIPELPMIPLRIFKNVSLSLILGSNFFFGMAYYSTLYYIPYYFIIIKEKTEVEASILLFPLVLCQAGFSTVSGYTIKYSGHYLPIIIIGYSIWMLGNGLLSIWNLNTSNAVCCIVLALIGVGVGSTFQPTMVAAQAQAKKADRAVVISTRNVVRSFGGAVGNAIASAIISNHLIYEIQQARNNPSKYNNIPSDFLQELQQNIYRQIDKTHLTPENILRVKKMYLSAMKDYFYILIPFIGLCLISSLFIKDKGLQCLDESEEQGKNQGGLSSSTSLTTFERA